ncbi:MULTISPECIES: peptide deformylase [unclassified Roseofilum]|uniref:peptide deformylase n=1 Tax=unclassified Roseofilum TaxID=2620099 RepID=UPI001AFEC84A|nr:MULTISPECIES: peptide deformylase [unclassified Roseofilum]MBP0008216.1 peptide deformylase [Roseofilum sp. Belize Diploria]MBP0015482.1 peptide deformylase [Roseofilum sp. SID3]MBP0023200.1 peptide deformylase [Roseofilum sp. SID2]MBP0039908.1 peptide deformylase [Roseofilum sp. SID1]MBP0041518.1 peptide deformylase [Roseofilum sp. SBFL]
MSSSVLVEKKKLDRPPLNIHTLGDRVLRTNAKRISKVDESIRQLAKEMLQTMYSSDGIGLAAPQVAIAKQLVVIDCDPEEAANIPLILINPTIKSYGRELCTYQEGCLSVPGVYMDLQRPDAIQVSYKDEYGRPKTLQADGLLSRAIQHELDHLQGVMFVDRIENAIALNDELQKFGFSSQDVKPYS